MNSWRILPKGNTPLPCCRCGQAEQYWDRIAAKAYCPQCQELLVAGEAPSVVEPAEAKRCAVCGRVGTLCYQTAPLFKESALAVDLCAEHLRALLGRRLGPHAFHQLSRQLLAVGVKAEEVFLLHGVFYDPFGRALRPVSEVA